MADKINTERLRQLSLAVTRGREGWSEFTMRVPADPDRDADLVLSSAANEIEALRAQLAAKDAEVARLREAAQEVVDDLLDLGLRSNNWVVDRLRAALKP